MYVAIDMHATWPKNTKVYVLSSTVLHANKLAEMRQTWSVCWTHWQSVWRSFAWRLCWASGCVSGTTYNVT